MVSRGGHLRLNSALLLMKMTVDIANAITGGLGRVEKMPCPSWGISAYKCVTGQLLRQIDNTTCSKCYACKGRYPTGTVRKAHDNRLAGTRHPHWVQAMAFLIDISCNGYFRWFDSGDIQDTVHFLKICRVAQLTPDTLHWLPTQERAIVYTNSLQIPKNLCVRISSTYVDQPRPVHGFPISFVSTKFDSLPEKVKCNAYDLDPKKERCGPCRRCWNKEEPIIGYKLK